MGGGKKEISQNGLNIFNPVFSNCDINGCELNMVENKEVDIKVKPVNTHDAEGNRFVFTHDPEDNSVWFYDNHKRDGYGIYAGDGCHFTNGQPISIKNIQYILDKLNELYLENQALKNDSEYHKIVMGKLDEKIEEWEFYFTNSLKRYHETRNPEDRLLHKAYGWTLNDLNYVKDELQGEEYE